MRKCAAIQVLREEHRTTLKKLGIAAPRIEVIGNWSSFEINIRSTLRQLMADEGLRRQMGERARAYCAERYSREKILGRWEEVLASVAEPQDAKGNEADEKLSHLKYRQMALEIEQVRLI